jgi:hypothetical protein
MQKRYNFQSNGLIPLNFKIKASQGKYALKMRFKFEASSNFGIISPTQGHIFKHFAEFLVKNSKK